MLEISPALFRSVRRRFSGERQAETGGVLSEWREAFLLNYIQCCFGRPKQHCYSQSFISIVKVSQAGWDFLLLSS